MAAAGEVKLAQAALEACRAAVIACHAASGLCRSAGLPASVKAAHCAEGLMRSAVALASAPVSPSVRLPGGPRNGGKVEVQEAPVVPTKKKRKKKAKSRQPQQETPGREDEVMADAESAALALQNQCAPSGSIVIGDLTELGIGDGHLVLAPPETRPAASSSSTEPVSEGCIRAKKVEVVRLLVEQGMGLLSKRALAALRKELKDLGG